MLAAGTAAGHAAQRQRAERAAAARLSLDASSASALYRDQVDERADLRGRRYYWIGGPANGYGDVPGSDCHAVRDGVVSVTPLDLDLTHAGLLERLPEWNVEGFERIVEEEVKSA